MSNLSVQLLSSGIIDPDLHYGIHAKAWWFQASRDSNNIFFWNPICIGMKTQFVLNNKNFILRVIKGNKFNASHPGCCCQCDEISGAWFLPLKNGKKRNERNCPPDFPYVSTHATTRARWGRTGQPVHS